MTELADAINQIKTQFEGVQSAMKTAQEQLAKTKAEHEHWSEELAKIKQQHAARVSELEAKKVAADRAAEENARRIKLNNDQVHEITRIRAELDEREKKVAQREKAVAAATQELQQRMDAANLLRGELLRREEEIKARYAKMKEAMA